MKALFLLIFLGMVACTVPVQDVNTLVLTDDVPTNLTYKGCNVEAYETSERSPLAQYAFCNYTSPYAEIVLEIKQLTNTHDLNGSYQYSSLHLRSAEGLISEDAYGDQSRFSVNSEQDYGGAFNEENVYYYHFWATKDLFLVHVTSKGEEAAKEEVVRLGEKVLSKIE